jgi:SAM-dependent methyltransferase
MSIQHEHKRVDDIARLLKGKLAKLLFNERAITEKMLRNTISAANAWGDIADAFGVDTSAKSLSRSNDTAIIFRAFTEGSIRSEKLRSKLHKHPFPDINKLGIYSDSDIIYHLGGGLTNAIQISSKAASHKCPFKKASRVLDFGCGTSRILRYMVELLPGPAYYASEVFVENINWGRQAFPEVNYLHQNNLPPLDIKDCSFDIIYAYSIFTHYEEELHKKWLAELHRLLKPGGILILTVHGETILGRCEKEEDIRIAMSFGDRNYQEIKNKFYSHGYVFYKCYDSQHLEKGGLDAAIFGISFISREYIQEHWTRQFELLEYDAGAVSNWQDYVVLQKQ